MNVFNSISSIAVAIVKLKSCREKMEHTFTERSIPMINNNITTKIGNGSAGNGTAGNDLVLELKKALPCKLVALVGG